MSRAPALFILLLATAAAGACASTGAVPSPFPVPGGAARRAPGGGGEPSSTSAIDGYAVAGTALGLRGTPYRNGGSDPTGFDCSGLVWYAFAQHGIGVPRTVAELFQIGTRVEFNALEPGDLVFFSTSGRDVTHVGLIIGADQFVHAPTSRGEVRVERLATSYWGPRFRGARRIR